MNNFILSVHLKSGKTINRKLKTEASLIETKINFDEELNQKIFSITSANESINIPTNNIDYYDLELVSDD